MSSLIAPTGLVPRRLAARRPAGATQELMSPTALPGRPCLSPGRHRFRFAGTLVNEDGLIVGQQAFTTEANQHLRLRSHVNSHAWLETCASSPLSFRGGVGAIVLGVGGRLAMRIFAVVGTVVRFQPEAAPSFLLCRGVSEVPPLGLVTGALIFFALRRWLPRRGPLRGLVYGITAFRRLQSRDPQPLPAQTFALSALPPRDTALLGALWKGGSDQRQHSDGSRLES